MRLIKKIEVNYLRSLYSATLDSIGDLNVIFGRNDSGKSNLLRALNLFFNEMIEPQRDFDFDLDMSDVRRQEARDAKGRQFIWIKITFDVPENYRGSLGDEIAVKRQWNRDGEWNQTVFPSLDSPGQQARLTRFLNDIDFTYIPAIKDLTVYADLIERMYGAAADTEAIRQATTSFVTAIGEQTNSLSRQLEALFDGPARLAPPTEMSRLFRNLDFAHGVDGHSLLRQKGDGIKARHIPELLRYINEKEQRKRIFLWGFEEPENSLDLGAAENEAARFSQFSRRADTQIFITSHSPAFYLSGEDEDTQTRRFFITKQIRNEVDGTMDPSNAASRIDSWIDAEASMQQAGLLQLPFVIKRMKEQRETLDLVQEEAERLRQQLAELQQPTLFVEGVHDVSMFNEALARVGGGEIAVRPLGGTPQTTDALVASVLEQGGLNPSANTIFLFDDDKAGRGAYRKLCRANPQSNPVKYLANTYAWALPRTQEFRRFLRRHGIPSDGAFFTAEFLYPSVQAAEICAQIVDSVNNESIEQWRRSIHGDYWPSLGQQKCAMLSAAAPGTEDWLFARGVPDSLKQAFAVAVHEQDLDLSAVDQIAEIVRDTLLDN